MVALNVIVPSIYITLVYSSPCRPREPEKSGRRNAGYRYYFNTTTNPPETSANSPNNPVSIKTITPRGKICAPYKFNETLCEYIGDRELCGYNNNPERVESKIKARYLSNGCWLKKGRVECGYREPFANPKINRPPVYPKIVLQEDTPHTVRITLKMHRRTTRATSTATTTKKPTTMEKECTEIHNRIVCRPKRS